MSKVVFSTSFLLLQFIFCFGQSKIFPPRALAFEKQLNTISFGSCNDENKKQTIWADVAKNKPDLWVWLGDIIYADTDDMQKMGDLYQGQKNDPDYSKFSAQCQIIGTWDDHDYGVNDGDKTFPKKEQAKEHLFNFLNVPKDNPAWNRPGAYQSYTFGPTGKKVKIILLDTRYFRDELVKNRRGDGPRYEINKEGDILGFKQWQWLENELSNSDAQLHLLCSSIQVFPKEHHFEKWANFPAARQKLIKLISKTKPSNLLILSGDRHIAEISMADVDEDTSIYEITSSGLTHTWSRIKTEPNEYRVGDLIAQLNFGVLHIDWSGPEPKVTADIKGVENKLYIECQLE